MLACASAIASELERRAIARPIMRIPTGDRFSETDGVHSTFGSANLGRETQNGFADGSCF